MNPSPPQSKRWRIVRRCLVGTAVFLTLIAASYTVEFWRGKRAWEHCKREMEAEGIKMDWPASISPPVPDDQNVFAVPEMREWFLAKDPTVLSERLHDIADITEADDTNHPATRVVVAEVAFSQPGSNSPAGFTVLPYEDPHANAEVARLIKDAVGPCFVDQWGMRRLLRQPEEIQPAKILLQCQTAPSANELKQFLTNGPLPEGAVNFYEEGNGKIEPAGESSYKLTMEVPRSAAELLARIAVLEPQFTVMRQAFQRPYARILGADQNHDPDFPAAIHMSYLARVLGEQAQCLMLLGRTDEALRDLTLSQDLCRIPDAALSDQWGALPTLLHLTVIAIDMGVIADGLSRHAWSEPQLAAFQEQLQKINFLSDIKQVMLSGPAWVSDRYPKITAFNLGAYVLQGYIIVGEKTNAWTLLKGTLVGSLIPRGWVYQNMVHIANGYLAFSETSDSAAQLVFPKKVDAAGLLPKSHPSLYNYAAGMFIPKYTNTFRNTARVQTQVHEALIACALERYRLAHNEYPEALDALVPQFLAQVPRDIIGGQPLHYRRTDDGKFLLYSVGWNETDDGGKPGTDDDWVWDNSRPGE